jgi:hypothetical protein
MPTALVDLNIHKSNSTHIKFPIDATNYVLFDSRNVHIKLRRVKSDDELFLQEVKKNCIFTSLTTISK